VTQAIFEMRSVDKTFDLSGGLINRLITNRRRQLKAVSNVDLRIERGSTLGIVGESGCGKSTIARMAAALLRPTSGSIRFEDVAVEPAARSVLNGRIGMIFQDPYASLDSMWRVADVIAEPIRASGPRKSRAEMDEEIAGLLRQVGLSAQDAEKYPHEFSGGQRQRISIARALSTRPSFLVCDEPTSALDVSVQAQVLNTMRDLQDERGMTYLFISHNLAVVRFMARDVAVMYLGSIVEMGDVDEVLVRPRHPYTKMLLEALPSLKPSRRGRNSEVGEIASPIDPPSGCAFHPRCRFALARCRTETPRPIVTDGVQVACHAVEEGRV
jgi:peptide/nickel transport system ATP-binding protein